jgi:hypothetical protein
MPAPLLLDETAVIGWAFNFLLIAGGLVVLFFLGAGWHFFASRASTGSGRFGRFVLLLLVSPLAAFMLLYQFFTSL